MSKIEDGGPAFGHGNHEQGGSSGMSLRDWIAGQALPSMLGLIGVPCDEPDELWDNDIARRCYLLADAMLAARSQP